MNKPERTPEEIKKGLNVCGELDGDCDQCSYAEYKIRCTDRLRQDALALIRQLETDNAEKDKRIAELEQELATVKRERDALLEYLTTSVSLHCDICKYESDDGAICCQRLRDLKEKCFEWRGVCPDTEVQGDG